MLRWRMETWMPDVTTPDVKKVNRNTVVVGILLLILIPVLSSTLNSKLSEVSANTKTNAEQSSDIRHNHDGVVENRKATERGLENIEETLREDRAARLQFESEVRSLLMKIYQEKSK